MDAQIRDAMVEATRASDDERVTFGEVVMKLMQAGVERYHTDLLRGEKTYYLPSGESEIVAGVPVAITPAREFSAAGVDAAVRDIQAGRVQYRAFCTRLAAAGCVGYHVSLAGQRTVYYGRTGDCHVESFPGAKREKTA
jgi:uncharacterized protein YbcV (DUF1398 family)